MIDGIRGELQMLVYNFYASMINLLRSFKQGNRETIKSIQKALM